MAKPLTSGVPQWKAMPSGALSSVVPTRARQRILPAFRSTATISPQGGLLHNTPRDENGTERVIANDAPCCRPKSRPGGGLNPSAIAALGISLMVLIARVVLA